MATLVAPFHLQRRLRQLDGALAYSDCLQLAEAAVQAVAEIRALTDWLPGGEVAPPWRCGEFRRVHGTQGWWRAAIRALRTDPWAEQRALLPRVRARLPEGRELCAKLNRTALNLLTTQTGHLRKESIIAYKEFMI